MMVIYKFGGASVKNVHAFKLLKNIVSGCSEQLIIVVSAMGKTTNQLEEIVKLASKGSERYRESLSLLKNYHIDIVKDLVPDLSDHVYEQIGDQFIEINRRILNFREQDFNLFYDQVVSMGEVLSTLIVSRYLTYEGIQNKWIDIRKLMVTDENYREALPEVEESMIRLQQTFDFTRFNSYVTQGFIGSAKNGNNTTLGREGSDYTAALLANVFNAQSVTLWKDVEGIFNADPALFSNAELLRKISYQEMIELAFYGAKIIHPKTIKPLRQKQIPLFVKSFFEPDKKGTSIAEYRNEKRKIPITIIKERQILISISLDDLSFINENHLSILFGLLNRFRLKANLMQHSAVSFSVCVDEPRGREVEELIGILRKEFRVLYNDNLTLLTIRHYTDERISELTAGKKIYVEQRSRNTVQYLTA